LSINFLISDAACEKREKERGGRSGKLSMMDEKKMTNIGCTYLRERFTAREIKEASMEDERKE